MPEQRKRLHCVAEITLSTTFLLASEVPAIAAFARSGLPQERNSKTDASGYQKLQNAQASGSHKLEEPLCWRQARNDREFLKRGAQLPLGIFMLHGVNLTTLQVVTLVRQTFLERNRPSTSSGESLFLSRIHRIGKAVSAGRERVVETSITTLRTTNHNVLLARNWTTR